MLAVLKNKHKAKKIFIPSLLSDVAAAARLLYASQNLFFINSANEKPPFRERLFRRMLK